MQKVLLGLLSLISGAAFADLTGVYVGGGLGYGMQSMSLNGSSNNPGTPTTKLFVGYQMADWIGAEAGYTYISQADNWQGVGAPSTTVYDLAFTPGFTIPATPVTIYARLGIDGISPNLNSSWYNQIISPLSANFEWGAGVKINIPMTRVFVRAEYINYGAANNNNNSQVSVTPSVVMINAAYVF